MKKNFTLLNLILFIGILTNSCIQNNVSRNKNESKFAELSGPYLGQEPPGEIPELFAPGLITTGLSEKKIFFSADGNECYWEIFIRQPFRKGYLFQSECINGKWTEPMEVKLNTELNTGYYSLSPDGHRLFFYLRSEKDDTNHLGYTVREETGWTGPVDRIKFSGAKIDYISCSYPSVSTNGNLYFAYMKNDESSSDIYMSNFVDEKYQAPVSLGDLVNTEAHECHPYISPDEQFLIFDASNRGKENFSGLYICFSNSAGQWGEAQILNTSINTNHGERRGYVSWDSKYLFFTRFNEEHVNDINENLFYHQLQKFINSPGNGLEDLFWVDAEILVKAREEYFKYHKE
ncbi:hypothetical protein KAR48_17965 [bacterium]|nr:hypothetical protein [bacterium]